MIRFLAEVYRRTEYLPERALAAAVAVDQGGVKVSKIDCTPHPTAATYWTTWGGTYDNPETTRLAVFLTEYLELYSDIADMITADMAMVRGTDCIYIATGDKYPWQYGSWETEISSVDGYASAIPNPASPSDDKLSGVRYPVRLQIPQLSIKLPDIINGSALQNATFSAVLENADGYFDRTDDNNIFNVPFYLLKSAVEDPGLDDFQIVRRGFVDDITVSFSQITIKAATVFRSLTEQACSKSITLAQFPDAGDNVGKLMPLAFGTCECEPIEVGTAQYLICDPDYYVSVSAVYDGDGALVDPGDYTAAAGILTMTGGDTPERVVFEGSASNKIGQIITDEMAAKSGIRYAASQWDTTETDTYRAGSPKVNIMFDGGTVQDLVTRCLKSDNAFLIEKSDGLLSLREWGETYTNHSLAAWQITQQPEKTYLENKYFCSSVRVLYYGGAEVVDASEERDLIELYRKQQRRDFETDLASGTDATALAASLLSRLGGRPDTFRVALGVDTSAISLLDTVTFAAPLTVNGRQLSPATVYIVKEIDVAQDVILIEAVS